MDSRTVDFLRRMIRRHPELALRLRADPPALLRRGRWRPVAECRPEGEGVRVRLQSGQWVVVAGEEHPFTRRRRFEQWLAGRVNRELAPWEVRRTLAGTDRHRGHTAAVVRQLLEKGPRRALALAARPETGPGGMARLLTSAVLWWEQLVQGGRRPERILLFVPEEWGLRLAEVLPHLLLPVSAYHYRVQPGKAAMRRFYPAVFLTSRLRSPYVLYPFRRDAPEALRDLMERHPGLDLLFRRNRWELSLLGYPVAWQEQGNVVFGEDPGHLLTPSRESRLQRYLDLVSRMRRFPQPPGGDPRFLRHPERWLESMMLKDVSQVDPCLSGPVYGQVPTCLEDDRKVVDALTVTDSGRLAILEFKVEKDVTLLFQGLDYWDRVRRHLGRGDLSAAGYFPGLKLSLAPPRLYLVGPWTEFHRRLEAMRRYITSEVEIVRVGVNTNWKRGVKVLRRTPGRLAGA